MGAMSNFWFLMLELMCILVISSGVAGQLSECQAFPECNCGKALNDRGVELGTSVNCSSRGLTSVPTPNTPFNRPIYELKLNNNNILSLGENILSTINITKLDLSGNAISSVHNATFTSLGENLKILILSGNSSSLPPKDAFRSLSQLEELVLENYNVGDLNGSQDYFLSFTKLRHLTLDNWNLHHIGPKSFDNHGAPLLSLTLLNQPLSQLPVDIFRDPVLLNLQKLRISITHINEVSSSAFELLNSIQELDLSQNHIAKLEANCFKGIEDTLIKLSLSDNILGNDASKLEGLKNLTNLEELDLSSNAWTSVPNLSQLQITKPLKLYLGRSHIKSVSSNDFEGLADKLDTLDLSSQIDILRIHPNTFTTFTKLRVLNLSRQTEENRQPLELPQSLTQVAKTLKELDVHGQEISPSGLWEIIGQLTYLEILNLASAKLINISNMPFVNVNNLKKLDLSSNQLNAVTQSLLVGPRATLNDLSLTNNAISTLSSCIFYQYSSFPITMAMGMNLLNCNCSLKWLWERIKNKTIIFPVGQEAMCTDKELLASKNINDFCTSSFTEPQCSENYVIPKLTVSTEENDNTSFTVYWQLDDSRDLRGFTVKVTTLLEHSTVYERNQSATTRSVKITSLMADKKYEVCVTANFIKSPLWPICTIASTITDKTNPQAQDGLSSEEIGIIAGCIVGAVVLLAILAAVFYLLVIRRRSEKQAPNTVPTQPRNFSKPELPSMNEDTRTFTKPKRPRAAGAPEHREGTPVATISDGQTGHGRVGRAHMLTSDGSNKTTGGSKPSSVSSSLGTYENDHRPLPPTPSRHPPPAGYYNQGFRDDKYDEINHGKESVL